MCVQVSSQGVPGYVHLQSLFKCALCLVLASQVGSRVGLCIDLVMPIGGTATHAHDRARSGSHGAPSGSPHPCAVLQLAALIPL